MVHNTPPAVTPVPITPASNTPVANNQSVGLGRERFSKVTNRKVVADICRALRQDAATAGCVKHCEINVDGDGVVTMSGKVKSQGVKNSFNLKAMAIAGVSRVENHCQVMAAGGEL